MTGEQEVVAGVQGAFKITSEADGNILVMDVSGLLRVDPRTGVQERVPNAGGLFAVVPLDVGPPNPIPLPPAAWAAGPLLVGAMAFRRLRALGRRGSTFWAEAVT